MFHCYPDLVFCNSFPTARTNLFNLCSRIADDRRDDRVKKIIKAVYVTLVLYSVIDDPKKCVNFVILLILISSVLSFVQRLAKN